MSYFSYPNYQTANGYMTESIRKKYITYAIEQSLLPEQAHRMADVISLTAPNDDTKPIEFWQLYSVLGQDRIVKIVQAFYKRVYADEEWFRGVFARIGAMQRHVNSQAGMWIDVMGGGRAYHGGEYRLSFHHTHNAMDLMNDRGAERWVQLMRETLDDPDIDLTKDSRVRLSLNTFLHFFMRKYAEEFNLSNQGIFGEMNPPLRRKINLMRMNSDEVAALSEPELREVLSARGVDDSLYGSKSELVNKALRL
jgi:truncated hemoglobin YjbI